MFFIKKNIIEVDSVFCLNYVSVVIGYICFKGNVVIVGDIELGMIVCVMGLIMVGGFIEFVNV